MIVALVFLTMYLSLLLLLVWETVREKKTKN